MSYADGRSVANWTDDNFFLILIREWRRVHCLYLWCNSEGIQSVSKTNDQELFTCRSTCKFRQAKNKTDCINSTLLEVSKNIQTPTFTCVKVSFGERMDKLCRGFYVSTFNFQQLTGTKIVTFNRITKFQYVGLLKSEGKRKKVQCFKVIIS